MRYGYFTFETIAERSRLMLEELDREGRRIDFVPERSALLVIDMQRYFLDKDSHAYIPSAPSIVTGIKKLSAAFKRRGRPVILTRHGNSSRDAGMLSRWWSDLIESGSPHSEIIEELNEPGSTVIGKTQYDAFYGTPLEEMLRGSGTGQLVITGVMTHLCFETTARSAFVRGFELYLPVDGTATYSEDFHRASFLNLSHGFAVPVLVDDLLAVIDQ